MTALQKQKIIGAIIIVLSFLWAVATGDGTSAIFFGIIGIGLITSKQIYIEFLKEEQPKESDRNGKRNIQRHFN